MNGTLLVTGASGQLGRAVLDDLLKRQAGRIIAATRSPEKLDDYARRGVEVRRADFDDADDLERAFAGADRMLLISTDALDEPGKRLRQHRAAVRAAAKAGIGHVVYTSIVNPEGSPILLAPDHEQTEVAIAAGGTGFTILRNNIYTDMFLFSLPRAIATGKLFAAAGEGRVGYVTRADCALAAAGALADGFDGKRFLDVTGPEALSQSDIAALCSKVAGKPVEYVPISIDALKAGMVQAGLPDLVAGVYASFDAGIAAGTLDVVSNAVQELSGQPPTSVERWLRANHDALLSPAAH